MPIHEYQCQKCGYTTEKIFLNSRPIAATIQCPVCKEQGKKSIAKKIMSKISFGRVNGYNYKNGYSKS